MLWLPIPEDSISQIPQTKCLCVFTSCLCHVVAASPECVFLPARSESSDKLAYPHVKLTRCWRPILPHTDGVYFTRSELCFTSDCVSTVRDCSSTSHWPLSQQLHVRITTGFNAMWGQEPVIDVIVKGGCFYFLSHLSAFWLLLTVSTLHTANCFAEFKKCVSFIA